MFLGILFSIDNVTKFVHLDWDIVHSRQGFNSLGLEKLLSRLATVTGIVNNIRNAIHTSKKNLTDKCRSWQAS